MMGKIFGESQTHNISDELNKHLDKNHDCSNTWSEVKRFLGYHHDADYPKEMLSEVEQRELESLKKIKERINKYNELVEKRKQIKNKKTNSWNKKDKKD